MYVMFGFACGRPFCMRDANSLRSVTGPVPCSTCP